MPEFNGKTGSTAFYEYIKQSGHIEELNEMGLKVAPLHNAKLLSEYVERQYEEQLLVFKADNIRNDILVDDFALLHFRLTWLRSEVVPAVEGWLSKTKPDGKPKHPVQLRVPDLIERERYKALVVNEIAEIESQLKTISAGSTVMALTTHQQLGSTIKYKSFSDLFINPADLHPCINALRRFDIDKPVLGEGLNWTGGVKRRGIIVGWIERLEQFPKISKISNRKELVILLNRYFENLNMGKDARVFDDKVDGNVADAFISLIPK